MTADDNHYPGPDLGTTVSAVATLVLIAFVVAVIFYAAAAIS